MTRPVAVAGAALASLVAGCGAPPSAVEEERGEVLTPSPIEEFEHDSPYAPPNPTLDEYAFGETHEDGVSITVETFLLLDPEEFAEFAGPSDPPAEWALEVSFRNNLEQPVDPAMLAVYPRVDDEEEELVHVVDYDGADASGAIGPGATVTVPMVFSGSGTEYQVTIAQHDQSSLARFRDEPATEPPE